MNQIDPQTNPNSKSMESSTYDHSAYLNHMADKENQMEGPIEGFRCENCKNKGYVVRVENEEIVQATCSCMKKRWTLKRLEQSGLKSVLAEMTFDKFNTAERWQRQIKDLALGYVDQGENEWMFFCGQVGSGKSHLCTAATGQLLKKGMSVKYMMWIDDSVILKGCVTDSDEYSRRINELKQVDVLYIDDFFKTQTGGKPSAADGRLAFEILNYRYVKKKRTIISSEFTIDELIDIDEGIGSRIHSMSKNFCAVIDRDRKKNYRLKV